MPLSLIEGSSENCGVIASVTPKSNFPLRKAAKLLANVSTLFAF